MRRRDAVAVLLGVGAGARGHARGSLDRMWGDTAGTALVVDVRSRRLMAVRDAITAGRALAPPGSTLKPFVLSELLRTHKLGLEERFACPGRLTIGGRSFNCSHPPVTSALDVPAALAYSCNCFTAHFAERFEPGELATSLERAGLASRTAWVGTGEANGRIERAQSREANQMQALGEEGVLVTVAELALGYRQLALWAVEPVRQGLESAVEYGTAQRARVAGMAVAGKTGSVRTSAGAHIAWFAGFAPSRTPEVVVAVMLQGRSGGADAAPVAGRILEAWREGRL